MGHQGKFLYGSMNRRPLPMTIAFPGHQFSSVYVFITEKYKQLPRRDEEAATSAADQCDVTECVATTTTTTTTRKSGTSSPQVRQKRRVRPGSLHRKSNTFGFVVSLVTM